MNVVRFDFKLEKNDFNKLKNIFEPFKECKYLNLEFTLVNKIYDDVCRIECSIIRVAKRVEITVLMDCYLNGEYLESGEFTLRDIKDLKQVFSIECEADLIYLINFNIDEIKTRAQISDRYESVKHQLRKNKNYFKSMLYNNAINNDIEGMIFLLAGIETLSDERNTKKELKEFALLLLKKFESFGVDEEYIIGLDVDMVNEGISEDYYNKALTYLYIKCLRLTTRRRKFDVGYDFTQDSFMTYFPNDKLLESYIANLKKIS